MRYSMPGSGLPSSRRPPLGNHQAATKHRVQSSMCTVSCWVLADTSLHGHLHQRPRATSRAL
eukprot:5736935-Alexandrium_andersonii.AAC.1